MEREREREREGEGGRKKVDNKQNHHSSKIEQNFTIFEEQMYGDLMKIIVIITDQQQSRNRNTLTQLRTPIAMIPFFASRAVRSGFADRHSWQLGAYKIQKGVLVQSEE